MTYFKNIQIGLPVSFLMWAAINGGCIGFSFYPATKGNFDSTGTHSQPLKIISRELNSELPANPVVYFESTAECGDLSEWTGDGGGHVFAGNGVDWLSLYTVNVHAGSDRAHTGRYSIRCQLPDPTKVQDATLYREQAGDQRAAYYSAWFWFDSTFQPSEWVNIFQFKTKMGTLSPLCDPTFVIMVFYRKGVRLLSLYHWPVGQKLLPPGSGDTPTGSFDQISPKHIPDTAWVHIEVYYKIDRFKGEVIVWQDNTEIFHVTNVNSQDSHADHPNDPGTLLFGPGVYSSSGNTKPLLLYLDDVKVTSSPSSAIASQNYMTSP